MITLLEIAWACLILGSLSGTVLGVCLIDELCDEWGW